MEQTDRRTDDDDDDATSKQPRTKDDTNDNTEFDDIEAEKDGEKTGIEETPRRKKMRSEAYESMLKKGEVMKKRALKLDGDMLEI